MNASEKVKGRQRDEIGSLLDQIQEPRDLRRLSQEASQPLAEELRADLIRVASLADGHLRASLDV